MEILSINNWQVLASIKQKSSDKNIEAKSDPNGIRTHITAVKGRCPNR